MTDGQVSTNNVVVLLSGYQASAADSNSPEAVTVGGGPVFVYRNGQKIEGTWNRASRTDPFTFADSTGAPILLNPGSHVRRVGRRQLVLARRLLIGSSGVAVLRQPPRRGRSFGANPRVGTAATEELRRPPVAREPTSQVAGLIGRLFA